MDDFDDDGDDFICSACDGTGVVERGANHDDGGQVAKPCRKCDGTGVDA